MSAASLPPEMYGHPELLRVDEWADDEAAKHADRVAAHLGIDMVSARYVLAEKIRAVARAAAQMSPAIDPAREQAALRVISEVVEAVMHDVPIGWLNASEAAYALRELGGDDLYSAASVLTSAADDWRELYEAARDEEGDVTASPISALAAFAAALAYGERDTADRIEALLPPVPDPLVSAAGGGGRSGRAGPPPSAPAVPVSGVPSFPRPDNAAGAGSLPPRQSKAWGADGRRVKGKGVSVIAVKRSCDLLRRGCGPLRKSAETGCAAPGACNCQRCR